VTAQDLKKSVYESLSQRGARFILAVRGVSDVD